MDFYRTQSTRKRNLQTRRCNSSVIRQKGESQNGCFKKRKQAKFSEIEHFLPPDTHTSRKENLPKSEMNAGRPLHFLLLLKKIQMGFFSVRSSLPEVFCKKGVLRNFGKFRGKHPCQRLFLNKVAGHKPATLSKKRLWHRCFLVNFAKFLRTLFLKEHLRWLLLFSAYDNTTEGIKQKFEQTYTCFIAQFKMF